MARLSFVFCFLFIFVMFAEDAHSLRPGDDGVCIGTVNSISTRKVSYAAITYCKSLRRNCRVRRWKTVTYKTPKTGTMCCKGWQHDAEKDSCKPICSRGCLNGVCIAPEQCSCSPPLYLDPARNYACIAPVCDPPCINSVCKQNEQKTVCECQNSTRRYNDTHCAFCDENYKINADLTCAPECNTPCVNGDCIAPNKCKCHAGFKNKDQFTCEADCVCVNGSCVEGKCQCGVGFSAVNGTHCVPCQCEGGECVLGQCVCGIGFELVKDVCEPVCDRCVNGACISPGQCICFEGHARSDNHAVCCRPECGTNCDHNGECPAVACRPRYGNFVI